MARKEALLRLHQTLLAKREALRGKLAEDLKLTESSGEGGDEGDAAVDGSQHELHSQLAALESRELFQIEKALQQLREGRYGQCDVCEQKIPIARLSVLPFAPYCIDCQRHLESARGRGVDLQADWESAYEFEGKSNARELTIGDLDVDYEPH